MEIIRCEVCNGTKNILGMGGIRKECYECKGVGYLSKEKESLASGDEANTKKPGRPKK